MSEEEAHKTVEVDDVGVQLDEGDEEDLLEYDDELVEEQPSDARIRNVAETLMKSELPKVTVEYKDTTFLLFTSDDKNESNNPIICENAALYQRPMGNSWNPFVNLWEIVLAGWLLLRRSWFYN